MNEAVARRLFFPSPLHKARWLAGQARLDALLKPVIAEARRFLVPMPYQRVSHVFRFVRDQIKYVRDPPPEQFADSAVILNRKFDDCDGKARVFCAILTAAEHLAPLGIQTEMVPVFPRPEIFTHIAAQVRWPKSKLCAMADGNGWLRAETCLAGIRLGFGAESAWRDNKGQLIYS